jgi:hypothetical protein
MVEIGFQNITMATNICFMERHAAIMRHKDTGAVGVEMAKERLSQLLPEAWSVGTGKAPFPSRLWSTFVVGARFPEHVVNQVLGSPLRLFDTWER